MPMPAPFDAYVEKPSRVPRTCPVAVARNRYSAPCELAGQMVSTRLYQHGWPWSPTTASSPIINVLSRLNAASLPESDRA